MIVWSSKGIIKESFRIFLQGTPLKIDSDEVHNSIQEVAGVGTVHGLHIWSISSSEVFLSCHICVDQSKGNFNTDHVIIDINSMLEKDYGIKHTTIQIENVMICGNEGGHCCR